MDFSKYMNMGSGSDAGGVAASSRLSGELASLVCLRITAVILKKKIPARRLLAAFGIGRTSIGSLSFFFFFFLLDCVQRT